MHQYNSENAFNMVVAHFALSLIFIYRVINDLDTRVSQLVKNTNLNIIEYYIHDLNTKSRPDNFSNSLIW